MSTQTVETFDQVIRDVRAAAPAVGLAALAGKSPNKNLKNAWQELSQCGVTLQRGGMNYRWRSLHEVSPKLGHAIEEVLVFGDALFSAWGKKQSPEDLPKQYLELKQRFSKIIKETEAVAAPKEEKTFSFFGGASKSKAEPKMELRLDQLDVLLEEAHSRSRDLLHKTETDLVSERAFHRATEWYVLALESAQKALEKLSAPDQQNPIDESLFDDLSTALLSARATTNAILSQTSKLLRVKETLHNKSIMFLTAHENTFTVIQGHLRSWKDIKTQTEALNGLSQTVKVGMDLMNSASKGIEEPMQNWNPQFITPETIQNLSSSFSEYDEQISTLVGSLSETNTPEKPKFTRWDDWSGTKKDLIEPILENSDLFDPAAPVRVRPTLREKKKPDDPLQENSAPISAVEMNDQPVAAPASIKPSAPASWSRLDEIVVAKNIKVYNMLIQGGLSVDFAKKQNWSPVETVVRVSGPLRALGHASGYSNEVLNQDLGSLSPQVRSGIDYEVMFGAPQLADWVKVATQKIVDYSSPSWPEDLKTWMAKHDDLDWSYLMQWNDLVYDLLILEQDHEQKKAVLDGTDPEHAKVRQGLVDRIKDFAQDPGLSKETLQSWNLTGLITRYAVALDLGSDLVDKVWSNFHNPIEPIDWNGDSLLAKLADEKEFVSSDNATYQYVAESRFKPAQEIENVKNYKSSSGSGVDYEKLKEMMSNAPRVIKEKREKNTSKKKSHNI